MTDATVEYGHWIYNKCKKTYEWDPWAEDDSENFESYPHDDERTVNGFEDDEDEDDEGDDDEEEEDDNEEEDDDHESADEEATNEEVTDGEVMDDGSNEADCSLEETEDEFDALIIYDFDDTLFPSTYLKNELGNRKMAKEIHQINLPDELAKEVDQLETNVLALLRDSLGLGTVKIVTNATKNWVENATRALMPYLWEFIVEEGIEVISAKYQYSDEYDDRWEYKKNVFIDKLQEYINVDEVTPEDFKFVSVGDLEFERYAALHLKQLIPKNCIKIIKLEQHPTMAELEWQVGMLSGAVRAAVESDEFVDDNYGS